MLFCLSAPNLGNGETGEEFFERVSRNPERVRVIGAGA